MICIIVYVTDCFQSNSCGMLEKKWHMWSVINACISRQCTFLVSQPLVLAHVSHQIVLLSGTSFTVEIQSMKSAPWF